MVGMRKNPKVGGGVDGTCEVTKNQTQHSPSDVARFGSSDVASFGSSDVASFGSSDVASFGSSDVASFGSSDVASFGSSDVASFGSSDVASFGSRTINPKLAATIKRRFLPLRQHFANLTVQIEEPDVRNPLSTFEPSQTVNKVVAADLVQQLYVWPKIASLLSHFSLASLTKTRHLS
ncbi:hypothetical protein Lal_00018677 [Lupinus albus]|nr:hypothetical protein Lal_00018677 [Lupinus albus]